MSKLALFDLDGTLADDSHRKHLFVPGQMSDYWLYENILKDLAFLDAIKIVRKLKNEGWIIGILSARLEEYNIKITREWLQIMDIPVDLIWMRKPEFQHMRPPEFKLTIYKDLKESGDYEEIIMFDDDPLVVDAIREAYGPDAITKVWWA